MFSSDQRRYARVTPLTFIDIDPETGVATFMGAQNSNNLRPIVALPFNADGFVFYDAAIFDATESTSVRSTTEWGYLTGEQDGDGSEDNDITTDTDHDGWDAALRRLVDLALTTTSS